MFNKILFLLALTTFSAGLETAKAQVPRSRMLELSCVHIYPIQMKYLEKHVNFSELSRNLEERTIDQYIKRLDPQKFYFKEADIKQVRKLMAGLFKKLQAKNCQSLDQVQSLYLQRVEDRVNYAKKYLGAKFKFNDKTAIVLDPDTRKRPKTDAEVRHYHEQYMQYQVATYLATDMKVEEARNQVSRNYERLLRRVKEMDKTDIWANYLDSYARSLDPHSSYLSADNLEDFEIQMRASLEGIGATLSSQDGFTVIEQLIPGGAASNSGTLKPKDKIIAVAQGTDGEFQNVIEMDLRDVVRLIRGPKGSQVKLKILRKAAKETERFEVTLVRDKIKLEDEVAAIHFMDREINGVKKKIALINLPSFYADNRKGGPSASSDLKKLLAQATKEKADAVVLDLSTNGGGSLKDAVEVSGQFFATGNVVKQSQRSSESEAIDYEVLKDVDPLVDWPGPLVVLISRISASASEIVSGTLQDYKRAVVVGGDHTFGKGTVQSVEYLPPGLGAIKTTVGMFFIPGGNSTQHRGVNADIVWPSVYSTNDLGEKTLDYSLPPKKIKNFVSQTGFVKEGPGQWKQISQGLVNKLKKLSLARVQKSDEFKKVKEDITKVKKKGTAIVVGELLKEKKDNKTDAAKPEAGEPEAEAGGAVTLSREERKKKYLERADIQEAVSVAMDLAMEMGPATTTLGATKESTQVSGQ